MLETEKFIEKLANGRLNIEPYFYLDLEDRITFAKRELGVESSNEQVSEKIYRYLESYRTKILPLIELFQADVAENNCNGKRKSTLDQSNIKIFLITDGKRVEKLNGRCQKRAMEMRSGALCHLGLQHSAVARDEFLYIQNPIGVHAMKSTFNELEGREVKWAPIRIFLGKVFKVDRTGTDAYIIPLVNINTQNDKVRVLNGTASRCVFDETDIHPHFIPLKSETGYGSGY